MGARTRRTPARGASVRAAGRTERLLPVALWVLGLAVAAVVLSLLWRKLIYWHSELEVQLNETLRSDSSGIMGAAPSDWDWIVEEVILPEESAVAGMTIGGLALRSRFGATVVGIDRHGFVIGNPGPGERLFPRDHVFIAGAPEALKGAHSELAKQDGYRHLTQTLAVNGRLHLRRSGRDGKHPAVLGPGDAIDLAGRRVPVVSVHDGEIGLLDNLGSVVGVPQVAKAVVKFSKSGTPAHIYRYHGLHAEGIVEVCGEALARTALEQVQLEPEALARLRVQQGASAGDWRELWPNPV